MLNDLTLQPSVDYKEMCTNPNLAAVLIQHVHKSVALRQKVADITEPRIARFVDYDLLYVLFIVYQALSASAKHFTHYDLHDDNVLMTRNRNDLYFEYHYHLGGRVVVFRSPWVPKIIDYGRSYVKTSKQIRQKILQLDECTACGSTVKPHQCLEKKGFRAAEPNSAVKNESHDLRLLNELRMNRELFRTRDVSVACSKLRNILSETVYGVGVEKGLEEFATVENLTMAPHQIFNVHGAFHALKDAVLDDLVQQENAAVYTDAKYKKEGEFHIYGDGRPMRFVKP